MLSGNQPPRIGQPFSLLLANLPLNQVGVMFWGFSTSAWGLFRLPLDLTPIGMPGCLLHTSVDLAFPLPSSGNFGGLFWGLALANNPSWVGLEFYNQALFLDPGANAAGAIMSNAGHGIIGQ